MNDTAEKFVDLDEIRTTQAEIAGELDFDDADAIRRELTRLAASAPGHFGIRSEHRDDRIQCLARIGFLSSRLVWLESCAMYRERWAAGGPVLECHDPNCGLINPNLVHVDH